MHGKEKQMAEILTADNFKEKVVEAKGTVLVDFFATWCGPCTQLSPVLEKLSKEEHLDIIKVDTDACPELALKFNISAVPTLIFFKNKKALSRTEGYFDFVTLKKKIEGLK